MAEKQKNEIEYEEETIEVEVDMKDNSKEEKVEEEDNEAPANIPDKLDKIPDEKIRGRIIIFNAEKSEFAKNLKIEKPGDYVEKK